MYFGVRCNKCGSPILFGVDRSEGNGPMHGAVILTLTCAESACGWRDDYSKSPVGRYRKGTEQVEIVTHSEEK
jgi:hypothetical protein